MLQLHGTNRLAALAVMGCLQFIRLGQAGKPIRTSKGSTTRTTSKTPVNQNRKQILSSPAHTRSQQVSSPPSRSTYTPPILFSTNETSARDGWVPYGSGTDPDDNERSSSGQDYDDSMAEDNVGDEERSECAPSDTPSTVAVMSAAKASPLLTFTPDTVNSLSDAALVSLGDTDPGIRLIERMIQNSFLGSVQPTLDNLQSQLLSTQQLAVKAEVRQMAQEFRNNLTVTLLSCFRILGTMQMILTHQRQSIVRLQGRKPH